MANHPPGNYNPKDSKGRFTSGKQYNDEPNKDRDIVRNTSQRIQKENEEKERNLKSGEYKQELKVRGYDIIHFHYRDRQEYQIWEDGKYLDEAESTNELHSIITELERSK